MHLDEPTPLELESLYVRSRLYGTGLGQAVEQLPTTPEDQRANLAEVVTTPVVPPSTAVSGLPPLVEPAAGLTAEETLRYSRHLIIPGFGMEAQLRLKNARVLVIGAGGLGSPALLYLAAAGVGLLGIVDDDDVELSNLQRQVIHSSADVGRPKVDSALERVRALNPEAEIVGPSTCPGPARTGWAPTRLAGTSCRG